MTPGFTGCSTYLRDVQLRGHRMIVCVPCSVGDTGESMHALLDTASEWSVLGVEVIEDLGLATTGGGWAPVIHTRFGRIEGTMERLALRFPAVWGQDLTIEVAWFVSQDWFGPTVVGWRGCLEHLRFAVDPGEDRFYFGEL